MTRLLAVFASLALAATACAKKHDSSAKAPTSSTPNTAAAKPAESTRFDIKVTENGFEPADVAVPAGKPVTLVFERKTDETCVKQVVLTMADGKKLEKELPLNTPVELAATFPKAGTIGYACGMDMVKGTITVQ
jgi:plastocyanin domain-containing protein